MGLQSKADFGRGEGNVPVCAMGDVGLCEMQLGEKGERDQGRERRRRLDDMVLGDVASSQYTKPLAMAQKSWWVAVLHSQPIEIPVPLPDSCAVRNLLPVRSLQGKVDEPSVKAVVELVSGLRTGMPSKSCTLG